MIQCAQHFLWFVHHTAALRSPLMRRCMSGPCCVCCRTARTGTLRRAIRAEGGENGSHNAQTTRIASSNTVLSPFCVSAEHSRYFTAPMSFIIATPCEYWMGDMRLRPGSDVAHSVVGKTHRSRSFSIVAGSSRKSSLVPTSTTGVCGA